MSAYFEQQPDAYNEGLSAVSQRGAWREWVAYFLSGVRDPSLDAAIRLAQLADLRQEWRGRVLKARASALSMQLLDLLFVNPVITIPQVRDRLGIGHQRAKRNVQRLAAHGILGPLESSGDNQAFEAPQIIRILSRSESESESHSGG